MHAQRDLLIRQSLSRGDGAMRQASAHFSINASTSDAKSPVRIAKRPAKTARVVAVVSADFRNL
jgi:hypothetical protein